MSDAGRLTWALLNEGIEQYFARRDQAEPDAPLFYADQEAWARLARLLDRLPRFRPWRGLRSRAMRRKLRRQRYRPA